MIAKTSEWVHFLWTAYYFLHVAHNINGFSNGVLCPDGWINGTMFNLPGCYRNVEKTGPFAQAVRRCIDADPRAHLLYLPDLIGQDGMKKLGDFAIQFDKPEHFYMGIIGTGTDINHTSYSWYKPTTKGHVMQAIHSGVWEVGYPLGSYNDFMHFCACAYGDYGTAFDSRCTRGDPVTLICHISDPSEEVILPVNTNVNVQEQYAPSKNCSSLWAQHGLLHYAYVGNYQSIQSAKNACQALDHRATLPNYKSPLQWLGLKEYIMDISDTIYNHMDIPIAAKRVANGSTYEMMDGNWLFSDWYPGQPDNGSTKKQCVTMNDLDGLMWRNTECIRNTVEQSFFVVCELNCTDQDDPKFDTGDSTISSSRKISAIKKSSSAFKTTLKSTAIEWNSRIHYSSQESPIIPSTVGKQTFSRIADASTESARKVNRSSAPISPATTDSNKAKIYTSSNGRINKLDKRIQNKIKNQKEYLLWFILPMCKTRSIKMRSNTGLLDESIWAQEDCSPMSEEQQRISNLLFIIAELVLIGAIAFTFLFMLTKRCQTYERNLHMWQEVTMLITHALVLVFVQRTDLKVACHIVSMVLQYTYTVLFCLLLIEALQALSINTNVLSKGSFLSYTWTIFIAFVFPIFPTAIMAIFKYNAYSSLYSCWLNYDLQFCYVTIGIITALAFLAVLLTEEAHMHDLMKLPFTNNQQYYKACVNLWTMYIRIPAHLASWSFTSFTVFYQRFALFPTILIINVSLGAIIIVTHTFSSNKVRQTFLNFNTMIKNYQKKKKNVVST